MISLTQHQQMATALIAVALSTACKPAAADDCKALPGAEQLDTVSGVVFIGETHGTQEVPDMTERLICRQLQRGRQVHLALEWPEDWTPALLSYLQAKSAAAAQIGLLEQTNWLKRQERFNDGLTSQAMMKLLESMRQWHEQGLKITVSSFDTRQWQPLELSTDEGMAAMLTRNIERAQADVSFVLSGEYHARLKPRTRTTDLPMAYLVQQARPDWHFMSLRAHWAGGSFWGCTMQKCGPMKQPQREPARSPQLVLSDSDEATGYAGQLYVGVIQASEPWKRPQP